MDVPYWVLCNVDSQVCFQLKQYTKKCYTLSFGYHRWNITCTCNAFTLSYIQFDFDLLCHLWLPTTPIHHSYDCNLMEILATIFPLTRMELFTLKCGIYCWWRQIKWQGCGCWECLAYTTHFQINLRHQANKTNWINLVNILSMVSYITGLVQDCSNSFANTLELL